MNNIVCVGFWFIVGGVLICIGFYVYDKFIVPMFGECNYCYREVLWQNLNCVTRDYIDWQEMGRVTLEQAIKDDMFTGSPDRNWKVYTEVCCNDCFLKYVDSENQK